MTNLKYIRYTLFLLVFVPNPVWCSSADTVILKLADAEKLFIQKNLIALASQYNVRAQQALEIQAKLYPNPIIMADLNIADSENSKLFNWDKQGQKAFSIEQLILLGGKRKNEIALSKQNTELATHELEELIRNLKLQLSSEFYSLYFNQLTIKKFNDQLTLLDSIIVSYEFQAKKGNIAFKEVIRLKSVYMRLNNDKTEIVKYILKEQENLQLLLQTFSYISPDFNIDDLSRFEKKIPFDSLLNTAYQNRPDVKISNVNERIAQLNTKLQKSMAVPNLSLGAAYDQRGGAFQNQVNLTAAMPFPLFYRNQGLIKYAAQQQEIAGLRTKQIKSEIEAQVLNAWMSHNRSVEEYQKAKTLYNTDFAIVLNGISENFQKRNITLLEFVDFFESYNQTYYGFNLVRIQLAIASETLNFSIGKPIF